MFAILSSRLNSMTIYSKPDHILYCVLAGKTKSLAYSTFDLITIEFCFSLSFFQV